MAKTANEIFSEKIQYLLDKEKELAKSVKEFQKRVYQLIVSEYLPLFNIEDGILVDDDKNAGLISQMDNYLNRLEKALNRDVLSKFAQSLLQSVSLSAEYYIALGFKKAVVSKLLKDKVNIEKRIGVTATGRLKKNGYLYQLGKTDQVRQTLKNYVINSLTGDVSFTDFQLGFRNLVLGNKRQKSLAANGAYEKYFDQYAYDTFNQVDSIANNQMARGLQLEHFIYEGSLITTSRRFCEKRAGKAFSVKETKKWKNDPDLIDKKTKNSYRPLIERGRYRCRHFIKYITKELYDQIK